MEPAPLAGCTGARPTRPYRVCVVGCGAIGTHIAGRLALGGKASVVAVARGEALAALRRGGTVHTSDGPLPFTLDSVCESAAEVGRVDAVVVAVKATQLPSLAGTLKALLQDAEPDVPVFFGINGIPWYYFYRHGGPHDGERLPLADPGGSIWEAIGPERAVHIVCQTACSIRRAGEVEVNSPRNVFTLCEPSGEAASPRARSLADALAAGGVEAVVRGNMRHQIWIKLLGNICFNPVSVLTGGTVCGMAADAQLRGAVLKPLIREATAVAQALGVDTSQFPSPEKRIEAVQLNFHPTSMLQDFRAARPLEIDSILGQVRAFAVALGVPTPTLEVILSLTRSADFFNAKRAADGDAGERLSKRPKFEEGGGR